MSKYQPIRYSCCWEDAELLLAALDPAPRSQILSIGSGGDNTFSLLTTHPQKLVVIDSNPVQLYLIELKSAAFKVLEYDAFLEFLGFRESDNRLEIFEKLKPNLSTAALEYWLQNQAHISKGVIHAGKFETYLRFFGRFVLPLVHNKKTIKNLTKQKTSQEQQLFYEREWNTRRWRSVFHLFFSRPVMAFAGRDKNYFREVSVPVSQFAIEQTSKHLSSASCQQNPFLHYILFGNFEDKLPHYARPQNFDIIRQNLDKLEFVCDDIKNFTKIKHHLKFNYLNLSNIFEYMPEDEFDDVADSLKAVSKNGTRYAYWNLMVNRELHNLQPHDFSNAPVSFDRQDYGFFYSKFITDQRLEQ